jgi:hypothetical protein
MARQTSHANADALRAFLLSRAVVWLAGVAGAVLFGVEQGNDARFDPEERTSPFGSPWDELVAPAARWDAVWFLRIAEDGYAPDPNRTAFFPLFPLLVRLGGWVVGSPLVAGILVSLAALLGALVLLHRLVALDFGRDVAALSVLLVAVFPGAVWLSSVYSEALFLLLSVGAVYAARLDRWELAGIAGFLAATTRSAGIVLVVPLALLWWQGRRPLPDLAWVLLVPAGVLAFAAATAIAGLGFMAPFDAQEAWLRTFAGPLGAIPDGAAEAWRALGSIARGEERPSAPFDPAVVNLGLFVVLLAVLGASAGALRRLPPAYGGYVACALVLPLSFPVDGQPLMSLPRFASVLWPLAVWLALVLVDRPRARRTTVGAFTVLLALTSWHVARWGWVA